MNRKLKTLLKIIFYICIAQKNFAQHPAFYQINDEHNLPSNEVYKVIQDDFGYIWIGCDAGLYRYDGFKFKQYTSSKQNGTAISFLQLDSRQRIWCKNFYGQIYRVEGDSLKIIKSVKTSNPSYPQFAIDNSCNLWLNKNSTLIKYNDNGDSITSINLSLNKSDNIISLHYFNGHIYSFTNELGLSKLDLKANKRTTISWKNKPSFVSQNCMFKEHNNKLYVLIKSADVTNFYGIYSIDENSISTFHNFNNLDNAQLIYSIYSDQQNLWATTSFGTFKITSAKTINTINLFSNEKTTSMLKDREGMYWFSSLHNGLYVVPNINVVQISNANSLLKENSITALNIDHKGNLLMGTYLGNVYELDYANHTTKEKYGNKTERFASVKKIVQHSKFTIISRGPFSITDTNSQKQYYPQISNVRDFEIVNDTIYMVLPELIIKAYLPDLIKNKIIYTKINELGGKAIEYNPETKTMYVSMGTGTFIYHLNGTWEELTDKGEHLLSNSLSYNNGVVWISTISTGIFGIIDKTIKYHYDTQNILSENKTRIVKATDEMICLNTDNALYAIYYKTNSYSKYDFTESISPKDINNIELYRDTIYLATNKGLFFFPKKMACKNSAIPNIKITSITLNDSVLNFKNTLELSYTNTNLKINFSGVALKSKQAFSYQYRLIGLDSNWIKVSPTTPYVLFSQMPSGNFVFQLKLINEDGVQSKTATLYLFVSTPFWQRWWFYLIVIVAVAAFVALLFIKRINHIKRRSELRNKVTASQLTALKSQMNPHFLFNTLNSLQDLILKHDIKNSNFYLNKFSHLMRDVLEVSGKDEIILSKEIKMLDTYLELEKLRFGEEFTFTIKTSENLDLDHLVLPPMIIQPFIENSIKHGLLHKKGIKLLEVEFKMEEGLICTILDNGIGRKKSEEIKNRSGRLHQSFATEATEKRIELLNSFNNKKYSFEIIDMDVNNISNGTKVIIKIPI